MRVHQIKMFPIEFSQYLIGMKSEINVQQCLEIEPNNIMILSEISEKKRTETGKHLLYSITQVDRYHGMFEELILDKIYLKREKELSYPKLKDLIEE